MGRRAQQDAAPGSAGTDCPIPRNGVNGAHLAPRAQGTEPRSLTPSSALVPPALTPFPLRVEQSRLLAGLPARGGGLQRAPIPACVPYSNPTASFHPAPVADRPHRGGDVPSIHPGRDSAELRVRTERSVPLCPLLGGAPSAHRPFTALGIQGAPAQRSSTNTLSGWQHPPIPPFLSASDAPHPTCPRWARCVRGDAHLQQPDAAAGSVSTQKGSRRQSRVGGSKKHGADGDALLLLLLLRGGSVPL